MTPFGKFRSQPSGYTGGQQDTLRLSCHDANWREHTETKASNTDALPTHYDLAGVEVFFNLGPRALEMLQAPRYLNPALGPTGLNESNTTVHQLAVGWFGTVL